MRGQDTIPARAIVIALLLTAVPARAQTAQGGGTWSLPEPTTTATPRNQGPVDAQNPVVQPRSATPTPVIVPSPPPAASAPSTTAPTPRPRPSAAPTAAASPRPAPSRSVTPPVSTPSQAPRPAASPTPQPSADATPPVQETATATPEPTVSAAPPVAPSTATIPDADAPAAQKNGNGWPTWWWVVSVALVVLAAGALALLRRRRAEDVEAPVEVTPVAADRGEEPAPPRAATTAPRPAPAPTPAPTPTPAAALEAAHLTFEPTGLRLSLVYATLQYRLTVTAAQDLPAGHLLGDMIGAHGAIAPEHQLAPPVEALAPLKPLPALAAGESTTLSGEIQLPLSAIRPVRQANASLFVPLVRTCLLAGDIAVRRVFTVGVTGGEALAPLRLDTGPREHRDLGAREVEAARAYPLSPAPLQRAG